MKNEGIQSLIQHLVPHVDYVVEHVGSLTESLRRFRNNRSLVEAVRMMPKVFANGYRPERWNHPTNPYYDALRIGDRRRGLYFWYHKPDKPSLPRVLTIQDGDWKPTPGIAVIRIEILDGDAQLCVADSLYSDLEQNQIGRVAIPNFFQNGRS